jgi:hypothetical protein
MSELAAKGDSTGAVVVKPGETATYTLTVESESAFDGVVDFELSASPLFVGYVTIASDDTSEGTSTGSYVHDNKPGYVGKPVFVRLRASAVDSESDPITGTISVVATTAPEPDALVYFADDVSEATFTEAELSEQDASYHELDLSSVVGAAKAIVVLNITASDEAGDNQLFLRPAGHSNAPTTVTLDVESGVELHSNITLATSADGKLEYAVTESTLTVEVTIAGYLKA